MSGYERACGDMSDYNVQRRVANQNMKGAAVMYGFLYFPNIAKFSTKQT